MLSFLPSFIIGPLAFSLFIINLIVFGVIAYPFALLKSFIPSPSFRSFVSKILLMIFTWWIDVNNFTIWLTQKIDWDIQGLDQLPYNKWVLILVNHRSWIDVPILQKVLNHRLPFLKFFVKESLRKLPIFGFYWSAIDIPFMKRFSHEEIAKKPELQWEDLKTTKQSCKMFKLYPTAIINFVEGTRFSQKKKEAQESPYQYLLRPKSGGVACVISEMKDYLAGVVDLTVVYDPPSPSFWDFMSGRVKKVSMYIHFFTIPKELADGDYISDAEFRKKFQSRINDLWLQKDQLIGRLRS